jgi:hypothetical protein
MISAGGSGMGFSYQTTMQIRVKEAAIPIGIHGLIFFGF